jgi:hypothetical protein
MVTRAPRRSALQADETSPAQTDGRDVLEMVSGVFENIGTVRIERLSPMALAQSGRENPLVPAYWSGI